MKKITFIIPCFNEEENIFKIHEDIDNTMSKLNHYKFDVIFVDDCSSDNTMTNLKSLSAKNNNIKFIKLAKNIGSHEAISCGLKKFNGDAAIILAADGQDPPKISLKLIEFWENNYKIVWGARKNYKRTLLDSFFSPFYYWLMHKFSNIEMHKSGADMILIDKIVIDIFNKINEKNSSIWGLISWIGFKQKTIYYDKLERSFGKSGWTFKKKVKAAIDSFVSFSYMPIKLISIIGIILSLISILIVMLLFVNKFSGGVIFGDVKIQGWTSTIILILSIGGFQIFTLGILGEYIWRILDQVRNRPNHVIEESNFE